MYLLIDHKQNTYLIKGTEDLHTKYGVVKIADVKKAGYGGVVESHMKYRFNILNPSIVDFIEKGKRGPQAVTLKDCGIIAAYTGISSGSKVVEAGVGSGILSMFMANLIHPAKLKSYEIREDFASIAKSNFDKAKIKNVDIKMKDIYDGIDEKDIDLIMLDLPEPWLVVPHAKKALAPGGYIVSYSPSIEQTKKFTDVLDTFMHETVECILRNWNTEVLRPHSRMIAHTGFITIARYLGKNAT